MLSPEIKSGHLNWQIFSFKLTLTAYNAYLINANKFFLQDVPVLNVNRPNKPARK
jgi:hypothetical protein